MWYFTWILGVGVALGFGIINVMWLETNGKFARDAQHPDLPAAPGSAAAPAASPPLTEDKRS